MTNGARTGSWAGNLHLGFSLRDHFNSQNWEPIGQSDSSCMWQVEAGRDRVLHLPQHSLAVWGKNANYEIFYHTYHPWKDEQLLVHIPEIREKKIYMLAFCKGQAKVSVLLLSNFSRCTLNEYIIIKMFHIVIVCDAWWDVWDSYIHVCVFVVM